MAVGRAVRGPPAGARHRLRGGSRRSGPAAELRRCRAPHPRRPARGAALPATRGRDRGRELLGLRRAAPPPPRCTVTAGRDALCIGLLLPDVLGTYSDRGNALVLAQRARWRGISVDLVESPAGSTPPTSCDIYVLGGGEDAGQLYAAEWLIRHR